jgi:PknH-like extracellular domain
VKCGGTTALVKLISGIIARLRRQCDGKTVIDNVGTSTDFQITDVTATEDLLSAVIIASSKEGGAMPPELRALGIAQDCIVEVEVPATAPGPSGAAGPTEVAAVRLVQLMLENVRTAKR